MKYFFFLFILLPIIACQDSNSIESINELADESVEMCMESGNRFLNGLEKNYYENKRKAGPFYKKGLAIDSISHEFFKIVNTYSENKETTSYEEIFTLYQNSLIQIKNNIKEEDLNSDFKLKPIKNEDVESLQLNWMKFNVAKLRYVALGHAYFNTDATYCGFQILKVNAETMINDGGQQSIFLEGKYMSTLKEKYVNLKSVKYQGNEIANPFQDSSLHYFHTFYANDLKPGNYSLAGTVGIFILDNRKITFDFEHKFEVE